MSDHNGETNSDTTRSMHSGNGAPDSQSKGESRGQLQPELAVFNVELNAACLSFVEDYQSAKLSMAESSLAIIQALAKSPDLNDEQRSTAYKAFFEQLREHERLSAASAERGRDIQPRPSSPSDGSDLSDSEDSSNKAPQQGSQSVPSKRLHDDEGDRADAGKRRIDESIIPFAQLGDLSGLGPDLQATLKLKENYTRNLDWAKQLVISNPAVPEFPQSLWKDVLTNNFVDLDKVLSGEYSTTGEPKVLEKFGDTGYALTAGDLKASKSVRSHGEWTIAWNVYSEAVIFAYPHRQKELRLYNAEITRLFAATLLESADRVIQFNRAVRSRAAKSNCILLSDFATFNDLSISHFMSTGAGASKPPAKAQGTGSQNPGNSNEICRRFNDGTCAARSCKFRHACFTCKARDHGLHMCGKALGSGTQPKLERK